MTKCPHCGKYGVSLSEVRTARGQSITLACPSCYSEIVQHVIHPIDRKHGAYIDENGTYHSSPSGVPLFSSYLEAVEYSKVK